MQRKVRKRSLVLRGPGRRGAHEPQGYPSCCPLCATFRAKANCSVVRAVRTVAVQSEGQVLLGLETEAGAFPEWMGSPHPDI